MSSALPHKPHHPNNDVPEEFEPGTLPVEPDEGPVPERDPDDPEQDRIIDPPANPPHQAQRIRRQVEAGRCP